MTTNAPLSAKTRLDTHQAGGVDFNTITIPSGVDLFSVDNAGDIRIEIIPYTVPPKANNPYGSPGNLWYERTYYTHRGIGVNSESYTCPAKTYGLPCPICEERARINRDPDGDKDIAKALAPKERQLWWIYNHAQPDKGLQLWEISHHNFGKLLDAKARSADPGDNWEYFADPSMGFTVKATFTEEQMGSTKFYKAAVIDFKRRDSSLTQLITQLVSNVPAALDDVIRILPYEQLKGIFWQQPQQEQQKPQGTQTSAPGFVPTAATAPPTSQVVPGYTPPPPQTQTPPQATGYTVGASVAHPTLGQCTVFKVNPDGTATLMDAEDNPHKNVPPLGSPSVPLTTPTTQKSEPPKLEKGMPIVLNGATWTVHKVAPDGVVVTNAEDDIEKISLEQAYAGRSTAMVVGSYENKPAPAASSGVTVPTSMNPPTQTQAPNTPSPPAADVPWDDKW